MKHLKKFNENQDCPRHGFSNCCRSETISFHNWKDHVFTELSFIDEEKYNYVIDMWDKTDVYKDYIQESFDNYWSAKRTAEGIMSMLGHW